MKWGSVQGEAQGRERTEAVNAGLWSLPHMHVPEGRNINVIISGVTLGTLFVKRVK